MSLFQYPGKVLWLASYPKSGNTWYRAFLTALLKDGNININELISHGLFASRDFFNRWMDIDSTELYNWESKSLISDIHRRDSQNSNYLRILKIHDAFSFDICGNPIIPCDVSHLALYFVRNPLDIVSSFANHLDETLPKTINFMNDTNACLVSQESNRNITEQMPQYLLNWSKHVRSWLANDYIPVRYIRYEDMLNNPLETFRKSLEYIGWQFTDEQILSAIEATKFAELRKLEQEFGFFERSRKSSKFFRKGTAENWRVELTTHQINIIKKEHRETMEYFGY